MYKYIYIYNPIQSIFHGGFSAEHHQSPANTQVNPTWRESNILLDSLPIKNNHFQRDIPRISHSFLSFSHQNLQNTADSNLKKSPSNPPLSSQKSQGPQDLNPTPLSILGESQLPGPTVYRQDFPLCHMALRRLLETTNSGKFIGKPIGKVM